MMRLNSSRAFRSSPMICCVSVQPRNATHGAFPGRRPVSPGCPIIDRIGSCVATCGEKIAMTIKNPMISIPATADRLCTRWRRVSITMFSEAIFAGETDRFRVSIAPAIVHFFLLTYSDAWIKHPVKQVNDKIDREKGHRCDKRYSLDKRIIAGRD